VPLKKIKHTYIHTHMYICICYLLCDQPHERDMDDRIVISKLSTQLPYELVLQGGDHIFFRFSERIFFSKWKNA
jgi:GTP-binding protein EngB required for normal cell division